MRIFCEGGKVVFWCTFMVRGQHRKLFGFAIGVRVTCMVAFARCRKESIHQNAPDFMDGKCGLLCPENTRCLVLFCTRF